MINAKASLAKEIYNKLVKPTSGGKKLKTKKILTNDKILYKGKNRAVYLGPRGGQYIKMKGEFVNISTIKLF